MDLFKAAQIFAVYHRIQYFITGKTSIFPTHEEPSAALLYRHKLKEAERAEYVLLTHIFPLKEQHDRLASGVAMGDTYGQLRLMYFRSRN